MSATFCSELHFSRTSTPAVPFEDCVPIWFLLSEQLHHRFPARQLQRDARVLVFAS
jgi:hypothetical protein